MAKKTKETKGERITKFFKKQFKLKVIMLDDDFGIVEERKSIIHLCDRYFEKDDGCDANFVKDNKTCNVCGAEVPKGFRCVDTILKIKI